MKVVILAGGYGSRITEESIYKPKPMIEIGGQPILWHIMKEYSHHGFNEFIICLGYKGYVIKEYFADYFLHTSDITFDIANDTKIVHRNYAEPWKVTLIDTGLDTMTGGRIKRLKPYLNDEPFLLTYGDGVSDVNIADTVKFHKNHGKMVTVTVVNSGSRFGVVKIGEDNTVLSFSEKNMAEGSLINGGYMVCNPEVLDFISGDNDVFERAPLEEVSRRGQLMAYKHDGFWQCMDTQRDKIVLEEIWAKGEAKWKVWKA